MLLKMQDITDQVQLETSDGVHVYALAVTGHLRLCLAILEEGLGMAASVSLAQDRDRADDRRIYARGAADDGY